MNEAYHGSRAGGDTATAKPDITSEKAPDAAVVDISPSIDSGREGDTPPEKKKESLFSDSFLDGLSLPRIGRNHFEESYEEDSDEDVISAILSQPEFQEELEVAVLSGAGRRGRRSGRRMGFLETFERTHLRFFRACTFL